MEPESDWYEILRDISDRLARVETKLDLHVAASANSRDLLRTIAVAVSPIVAAAAVAISVFK